MKPAIFLSVNGGKEIAINSAFDFYTYTLVGVRGGFEISPLAWVTFFGQGGYENDQYDADFPLFFEPRHDQLYSALGGVEFKITDSLSVRTSVSFAETQSNIPIFSYHREIGQAALRWSF